MARTHIELVGVYMNKEELAYRKKMMNERSKDPKYLETSYERQNKRKEFIDDRKRVA